MKWLGSRSVNRRSPFSPRTQATGFRATASKIRSGPFVAVAVAALVGGCGDELSALLATDVTFLPSFASAGDSTTVQVVFSTFDKSAESTVELVGYTFPTSDVELESFKYNTSTNHLEMQILIVTGAAAQTVSLRLKVRVNGACCVEASGPFQIVGL